MPEQGGIDHPLSAPREGGEVRAGKTPRYKGAINEGEVDMIYTPNGCIYNDGGILVRCHDFTPGHMGHFWHLQQHFRQYTDRVKHRKAMRNGTDNP
jgi:hypothetical protein